jgi:hypothetical protein
MAEKLKFHEMKVEEIRDRLRPEIDKQVTRWLIVARGEMLAEFGEEGDLRATLEQLIQFKRLHA